MSTKRKQIEQFIELRADGFSYDEISKKINISKPILVKLNKDYEEKIDEVITIKEEQFIAELRTRNLNEVKQLMKLRGEAYTELEKRELGKMGTKELLLLIKNIEAQISQKTNIDQFKQDLYKAKNELDRYEHVSQSLDQIIKLLRKKNIPIDDAQKLFDSLDIEKINALTSSKN